MVMLNERRRKDNWKRVSLISRRKKRRKLHTCVTEKDILSPLWKIEI